MKILQITPRFHPSVGGVPQYVHEISREFVREGHDVTVVTTNSLTHIDSRGFSTGRGFTLRSRCPSLPKFETIDGIKIYRFHPFFQFWSYMINPGMLRFLLYNAERYDVIHVHGYVFAESNIAMVISKLKGNPFVLTAHYIPSKYGGFYKKIKKLYDITLGGFVLNSAKYVIGTTQEQIGQYMELGVSENKIKIIPCGVDIERFKGGKPERILNKIGNPDHVVLCVSEIVDYKGLQHIIKAIPNIIDDYPNIKFVFVGKDTGYRQELIKIANNLGVLNYCELVGSVDDKELVDYYACADVFILPSTGEGFGMVALESIVSGVPAILADYGGLKYVLRDIGGYPLNMAENVSEQLANYVKYIFSNPEKVNNKIKKQKQIIKERYTWERVAELIEEVYEESLSGEILSLNND